MKAEMQVQFLLPVLERKDMIGSWVCVVGVVSNKIYYSGKLVARAAAELDPGTCYGWGLTEQEAQAMALEQAARFRKQERAAA